MSLVKFFAVPAIVFLVLALPALLVVEEVSRYPGLNWSVSIALMTGFVVSMAGIGTSGRAVLALIVTLFVILNTALSVSFILQGTAFNDAFFSHLDRSTLAIAWQTDAMRLMAMGAYVLIAPLLIFALTAKPIGLGKWLRRVPLVLKLAVFAASLWLSYPLTAIADYRASKAEASERLLAEIARVRERVATPAITVETPRNLVILYLESVEQTYFDETLFPGLLPNLSKLRDEAVWFSEIRQFPGTGWTIAGIVSSQCGVPLLSNIDGNRILTSVDNPFSRITCLAEYLKKAGFATAYIGGATLEFAGKGSFLTDNGYDVVLGIDELPNATGHRWGMYDNDLFAHAKDLFDGLAAGDAPFLLTLLTLDTHHPFGTPSPGCRPYAPETIKMLDAVHCADQLVQDFVDHVRASPVAEETVIAIMSDHLFIKGEVKDILEMRERKPLFFMLDPRRAPERRDGPAAHFDIAPTLLEAVGLKNAQFSFGQSLLSHDKGLALEHNLTEDDFRPFTVEALTTAAAER